MDPSSHLQRQKSRVSLLQHSDVIAAVLSPFQVKLSRFGTVDSDVIEFSGDVSDIFKCWG